MKRQLNDSDEKSSNKICVKNHTSSFQTTRSINEYCIYWLDESHTDLLKHFNINQSRLRGISDYLETFDQFDDCDTAIHQNIENKIFIIVNASSCLKLLTLYHDLQAIHSIYTYRDNESIDQSVIDQCLTYKKLQGIFAHPNEVFLNLSKTVRIYARQTTLDETTSLLMPMPEKVERTTALHSRMESMNWFTYLYDTLEEIPGSNISKEKFVQECRIRYNARPPILRAVEEFNETYDPQHAIWWYTREGFLFRFLNRALRQQDQNDILLLHFFIFDLARQLKRESDEHQDADWMYEHVYRGQLMSIEEIKFIEKRKKQTLYVNTFLSTSTDLDVVRSFAGAGCNDLDAPLQSVILDITGVGSGGPSEKSVADIHRLSFSSDEQEILFSAAYTFVAVNVVYDDHDKLWNIQLGRIIDAYDLRVEFDQRLIKLDVLIRLLLDEADSSMSNLDLSEDEKILASTFANDFALLLQELVDYESPNIILNHTNEKDKTKQVNERSSPFQLIALRTFAERSLTRQYKISALLAMTLHDCLANLYKDNGKCDLAFEHFNKATAYSNENENIRTNYTRKVNLAQAHKVVGHYETAWLIYEELHEDELTELYEYERLLRDIALDLSYNNGIPLLAQLQHCFDYLEYVSTQADLEADGFTISEVYTELGRMFLYNCKNSEKAIVCCTRDLEIRRVSDPDESIAFGPSYERLADAYAFFDTIMALENYQNAIEQYSRLRDMSKIDAALCWCKYGYLLSEHQAKPFDQALTLILSCDEQEYISGMDEIASCLLHLAKSCARCESLSEMTLELCQTMIRLYSYDLESEPGINNDSEEFIELLIKVYAKKSRQDGSITPTKEELLQTCKNSQPMSSNEIVELLKSIQQKLNATSIAD